MCPHRGRVVLDPVVKYPDNADELLGVGKRARVARLRSLGAHVTMMGCSEVLEHRHSILVPISAKSRTASIRASCRSGRPMPLSIQTLTRSSEAFPGIRADDTGMSAAASSPGEVSFPSAVAPAWGSALARTRSINSVGCCGDLQGK